jgi:hypothetical protein
VFNLAVIPVGLNNLEVTVSFTLDSGGGFLRDMVASLVY